MLLTPLGPHSHTCEHLLYHHVIKYELIVAAYNGHPTGL